MVYLSQPQQTVASSVFKVHRGEVYTDIVQVMRWAQTDEYSHADRMAGRHVRSLIRKRGSAILFLASSVVVGVVSEKWQGLL